MIPPKQPGYLALARQLILTLSLTLCFPEAKSEEDLFSLSFEELLDVKITGASLTDETFLTAPAAVSALSGEEIDRLAIHSIGELMNYVPGFQMSRNSDLPFLQSHSARARRSGASSRESLVMVNGMRVDAVYAGGNGFAAPVLSASNIERVEFIRGPASALYGSNAFLGVVNIVTRKDTNNLKVSYGTHNSKKAALAFSRNLDGLEVDLHIESIMDDGASFRARDRFSSAPQAINDPFKSVNGQISLKWGRTTLQAIHYSNKSSGFFASDVINPDHNLFDGYLRNLSLTHSLKEQNNPLQIDVSLGFREQKDTLVTANSPPGIFEDVSSPPSSEAFYGEASFHEHEPWAKIQGSYDQGTPISFQFGVEYRAPELEESEVRSSFDLSDVANGVIPIRSYPNLSPPLPLLSENRETIRSAYVQQHVDFDSAGVLTLGLRTDEFSKSSGNLSPRAAYVFPISSNQSFKAVWGEAFRSPAFNERFPIANPVVRGDPNLKPETVETTELTWVGNWESFYATATLFENSFNNPIIQQVDTVLRQFINGPSERSRGIETELIVELTPQLTARANYTRIFEKPEAAFREADTFASMNCNWNGKRLNLNLGAIYQCARQTIGRPGQPLQELDDYWIIDAKASFRIHDSLNLSLSAKNLFDQSYFTPAQGYLPGGVPNRGQELEAGLHWSF